MIRITISKSYSTLNREDHCHYLSTEITEWLIDRFKPAGVDIAKGGHVLWGMGKQDNEVWVDFGEQYSDIAMQFKLTFGGI